jgi:hypothetical protein
MIHDLQVSFAPQLRRARGQPDRTLPRKLRTLLGTLNQRSPHIPGAACGGYAYAVEHLAIGRSSTSLGNVNARQGVA